MASVADGGFGIRTGPCPLQLLDGAECNISDVGNEGNTVVSAGVNIAPPVDGVP